MADESEVDVNVRLETVPTMNGIDVVMRLFNMDASRYTLDRLGLSDQKRAVLDGIISKPHGLVMVVGPTGSGKTTTLYSVLNTLNSEERKIITVEDPVEYQFPGIVQIRSNPQKAATMAVWRQTALFCGWIQTLSWWEKSRDNDTVPPKRLQAAMTGHLVLATFHASSAAAA